GRAAARGAPRAGCRFAAARAFLVDRARRDLLGPFRRAPLFFLRVLDVLVLFASLAVFLHAARRHLGLLSLALPGKLTTRIGALLPRSGQDRSQLVTNGSQRGDIALRAREQQGTLDRRQDEHRPALRGAALHALAQQRLLELREPGGEDARRGRSQRLGARGSLERDGGDRAAVGVAGVREACGESVDEHPDALRGSPRGRHRRRDPPPQRLAGTLHRGDRQLLLAAREVEVERASGSAASIDDLAEAGRRVTLAPQQQRRRREERLAGGPPVAAARQVLAHRAYYTDRHINEGSEAGRAAARLHLPPPARVARSAGAHARVRPLGDRAPARRRDVRPRRHDRAGQ